MLFPDLLTHAQKKNDDFFAFGEVYDADATKTSPYVRHTGMDATLDFAFQAGTLKGAQGTIPGANPADDFKKRASAWHKQVEGSELSDYSYAAESYDATILAGLAAIKGGATDPATIQANLHAVSGANGGEECTSYAACKALLKDGKDIQYKGVSGAGPFNDKNDPSSAFIGIYKYDENNKPIWQSAVEGKS